MKLVSVIMSAYDAEKTLVASIESILNQNYENFEFIIIDDFSSDGTTEILKNYEALDERIFVVRNSRNLGLPESLNVAFKHTKGAFIARMDADDVSLPERLEKQVNLLQLNESLMVVGSSAHFINPKTSQLSVVNMPESNAEIKKSIFKSCPFIHPTVIMRREFLEQTKGYNGKYRRAQDYELWMRGRNIGEYGNVKEPLLLYTCEPRRKYKSVWNSIFIRFKNISNVKECLLAMIWSSYELLLLIQSVIFKTRAQ